MHTVKQTSSLTPPCTPIRHASATQSQSELLVTPTSEECLSWKNRSPRTCRKSYQRSGSESSGYEVLGHGAWSTVYRAIEISEAPSSTLLTPPTSPSGIPKPVLGQVLAVKAPARKDAYNILYDEACTLTYLHSHHEASNYIVPFHGYDTSFQSLLMDAVPLDLGTHAKLCLKKTRDNFSTRTMFDPVCGPREWQSLASQLIDGLIFLHSNRCVHGDIKPSNILLRPNDDGLSEAYTPMYCDFSSARIFEDSSSDDSEPDQQLTALTPDFTSPELFTSLHSPTAVATTASDVYALAVTLVVAAIGTSPYAGASMEMMKLSMAREGRVLDFARQAEQGTRVMKGKMVEQCLKDALERDVGKRSTAPEWKENYETICHGLN